MNRLWWHTQGQGKHELVLLHGWGLNAEVWRCVIEPLSTQFRVHLVDLPGFGRSEGFGVLSLAEMTDIVLDQAPAQAIWLGWSLGGLVATYAAYRAASRVSALVTVASSPCFTAQGDWPGIKPQTLAGFQQQLSEDFQRTVERFLALQTLGSPSARQDTRALKAVVLDQPMPEVDVLAGGLEILKTTDLRPWLCQLLMPQLRIYGHLDGLVPRKIATLLESCTINSESVIFPKAAHAPFISHPEDFCEQLAYFKDRV